MNESDSIATLSDIVRLHGRARPHARALIFEGRVTTFGALDAGASQVANALRAAGLRPGDRIAHWGKNSDAYFELLMGAARVGVVMTPVNWRLAAPEVAYILADCGAKMLFVGPEFGEMVQSIASTLPAAAVIGMETAMTGGSYQEWRDNEASRDLGIPISSSSPAVQLYTSGTTGRPKGAVLSHANFIWLQQAQSGERYGWNQWAEDDVALAVMPAFHIAGLGWTLTALYNGSPTVLAREFDAPAALEAIATWRVTKILAVPSAVQMLVAEYAARSADLSSLRYVFYGASPMPLELLRRSLESFNAQFVQLYGMTETAGGVIALGPEDHDPVDIARMRSAGRPLAGVEVAVWSEAGHVLAPGKIGELVLRCEANMLGYWQQPEATARALSADGWLRTGDAGYIDADGYVFIKDRVKDLIISGGENIYPAEVENAIYGHPDVADVAVIGVPSPRWGEEAKAIVVLRAGVRPDPDAIIAWARMRIARFKVPKTIDFVDALPRTASGKILRRSLREPYWAGREGSLA